MEVFVGMDRKVSINCDTCKHLVSIGCRDIVKTYCMKLRQVIEAPSRTGCSKREDKDAE